MKRIPVLAWFLIFVACFSAFVLCQEIVLADKAQIHQQDYSTDYEEMRALDRSLPLAAREIGMAVADFEKKELVGGKYYYEAKKGGQERIRLVCENVYETQEHSTSQITLYQIKGTDESVYSGQRVILKKYSVDQALQIQPTEEGKTQNK